MANCWLNAPSGYARHLKTLQRQKKKKDKDDKNITKKGKKITS
jgi:hypothetical protein